MNTYKILNDNFRNREPCTLDEIRELVDSGQLSREQEVLRVGEKDTVSADYALIFHEQEEEVEGEALGYQWKKLLGATMCLVGVGLVGLLIYAYCTDRTVGRRQGLVAVMFLLIGIKVYQMGRGADSG